jgi:predicted transcriptional regulator
MSIVWDQGEPVTSTYIMHNLTGRSWALSTVMTVLARLCEKGFLNCDRSTRTNLYSALVDREDYTASESALFMEELHGNSLRSLVSALRNSGNLTRDDIDELRTYLDSFADPTEREDDV